jgi:hypothetical protein
MERCGQAVRQGGHVYYIGVGSAAILGCIDASEMPDTYGSSFDQTRGFVSGGWLSPGMQNHEGDLSSRSYLHRIGLSHFKQDIVPKLSANDAIVVLASFSGSIACEMSVEHVNEDLKETLDAVRVTPASVSYLVSDSVYSSEEAFLQKNLMGVTNESQNQLCFVHLPSCYHEGFHDLAIKLMTNACSTFAQAFGRGALYRSFMIATGPANDKIYSRCLDLIASQLHVSHENANVAMLRRFNSTHSINAHTPHTHPIPSLSLFIYHFLPFLSPSFHFFACIIHTVFLSHPLTISTFTFFRHFYSFVRFSLFHSTFSSSFVS